MFGCAHPTEAIIISHCASVAVTLGIPAIIPLIRRAAREGYGACGLHELVHYRGARVSETVNSVLDRWARERQIGPAHTMGLTGVEPLGENCQLLGAADGFG